MARKRYADEMKEFDYCDNRIGEMSCSAKTAGKDCKAEIKNHASLCCGYCKHKENCPVTCKNNFLGVERKVKSA